MYYVLPSLCLCAFLAGVVNSVAGGGTLLTFPALSEALRAMHGDKAMVIANATSTVALVPASLASAWAYRREIPQIRSWLLLLIGPCVIGGLIGALLMSQLNEKIFNALVPWLLLTAAILFLIDTLMPRRETQAAKARTGIAVVGLMLFEFMVAVYGGYFGAGIGIVMLGALALMRVGDIHQMNALKVLLGSLINGVAVVVFVWDGLIDWREWCYALPMAAIAILGGYYGARLALRVRPRYVRWCVIVIGFGLAVYYFLPANQGQ